MNNNRNNRRRGRGNNRNQGGGGNANRIDSRARGNAPQLLDKYKKLAQDAQHNGDRVQMEYYLQFADHYFRVIADNKARQDESRGKRFDERELDEFEDEDGEDRRHHQSTRRERARRDERRDDRDGERGDEPQGEGGEGDGSAYEPVENPFTRREDEPRKRRAPRKAVRRDAGEAGERGGEIDAAVLPPALGSNDDDAGEKPAPRRRRRKQEDSEAASAA
ncbi:MAG: DUF4167 domain-containing protein [Erythrobacter sp.]